MTNGGFSKARRLKFGANIAAMTILGFVLLVMANYLASRHYARFDMTANKRYTISQETVDVLKNLKKPVKAIVVFRPVEPMYDLIVQTLREYERLSDNFQLELVDPDRDLDRLEQLKNEYDLTTDKVIIFASDGQKKFIYDYQLVEYDYTRGGPGMPPPIKAFKGEQFFTSAIVNVTKEKQSGIYFTTGHGERAPNDYSDKGLSGIAKALRQENAKTERLELLKVEKIPDDCDLLVICGPRYTFMPDEVRKIRDYLKRGGKLLVALDPGVKTGLEELLRDYGVEVENNLVLDKQGMRSPANIVVGDFPYHAITRGFRNVGVIMPFAREVKPKKPEGKDWDVRSIARSSSASWCETDLEKPLPEHQYDEGIDKKGPISLAVAVAEKRGEQEDEGFKIVVLGDSDFMANGLMVSLGNAAFISRVLSWLGKKEQLLNIAAKPVGPDQPLILDRSARILAAWLCFGILPGAAIAIGAVVFYIRRR